MHPDIPKYIFTQENGQHVPIDTSTLTQAQLELLVQEYLLVNVRPHGQEGSGHHRPTAKKQRPGRQAGKSPR